MLSNECWKNYHCTWSFPKSIVKVAFYSVEITNSTISRYPKVYILTNFCNTEKVLRTYISYMFKTSGYKIG